MAKRPSVFDEDGDDLEPRNDLLDIIPDQLTNDIPVDEEPRRGRSILMGVALVGISVAGAAAWFMFMGNGSSGVEGPVAAPTIPADPNPYKIRPANPGGMQVPNQDKSVYERLTPGAGNETPSDSPTRLMPEPPAPVAPSMALGQGGQDDLPEAPDVVPETTPPMALTRPNSLPQPDSAETAEEVDPEQQEAALAPAAPAPPPAPPPAPAAPAPAAPAVAPKPVAPAPAPAAPAPAPSAGTGGSYTIQLAALRDEASARKMWQQMQTKYPSLLGGLTLVIEKADLGQKGTFYRVRGTGISSEARAREVCAALSKDKVGCLFVGK